MGYSFYIKTKDRATRDRVWRFLSKHYKTPDDVIGMKRFGGPYHRLCKGKHASSGISYAINNPNIVGFDYSVLYGPECYFIYGLVVLMGFLTKSPVYYDHEQQKKKALPHNGKGIYVFGEQSENHHRVMYSGYTERLGRPPNAEDKKKIKEYEEIMQKFKAELERLRQLWIDTSKPKRKKKS